MDMLITIPNIEFVKGIRTALEQDAYFNVNKRNLIVFDDQMIDAAKIRESSTYLQDDPTTET